MSAQTRRIIAVGDLTADLIVEVPELPITAESFQIAGGFYVEPGGSANLLILLSRFGISSFALGATGTDLWGEQVFLMLEEEGVEVSLINRQGTTTLVLVLVDDAGHHSFVGSFGKGEAMKLGEREKAAVAGADALFASGYSLEEDRLRDLTLEALQCARHKSVPRFLDPGPAFKRLDPGVKARALASSDVLLLTEEELQDLSPAGAEPLLRRSPTTGSSSSKDTAVDGSGPHTVVVKRGTAGCRVFGGRDAVIDIPGLPVTLRDTTAAGDCFDAGYLLGYLKGWPPLDCARLANCAGAAAVRKVGGGRNVPTMEEVRLMISQMGGGIEI